ncbi:MAG TPA: glycoside hydrolase family 140 protein [Candidatus Didemnitutus sp.]|jgi:hypothetical protein
MRAAAGIRRLGTALAFAAAFTGASAALPPIRVDPSGHFFCDDQGRPFFWLADTAWELVHRTTPDECSFYLRTRAHQGFTVVQAVVLAEFDGVNAPTPDNLTPFVGGDPARPNDAYFDRVVAIADEAARDGLYMAFLPAWGDKLTAPWGTGPRLFRLDNLPAARAYGRYLATRLRSRSNVFWMLGGDRPPALEGFEAHGYPREDANKAGFQGDYDWRPIWREMAAGITEASPRAPVILYHPQGGPHGTSFTLQNETWLSVNGYQSGHGGGHDQPVWDFIAHDYALKPVRPVIDLEPNYEDHPYNPWPRWDPSTGYFRDHDVRKQLYRAVFAGAAGATYGHHAVWGFVGPRNDVINHADRDWISALHRPAADEVLYLRQLMESRPYFSRIPDPALITDLPAGGGLHACATRDREGRYAMVYVPLNDETVTIDLSRLRAGDVTAWWYDPRLGFAHPAGNFRAEGTARFTTPPFGPDWVLVLDSVAEKYAPPGTPVP